MNCISCHKELVSSLSICPRCGTMVADSVREELALKISPITKLKIGETKTQSAITEKSSVAPAPPVEPITKPAIAPTMLVIEEPLDADKPAPKKTQTAELVVKPTSPTLMEFNNKNATLPDWRLQMQNAVVKRRGGARETPAESAKPQIVHAARRSALTVNGATALKVQTEEKPIAVASAPRADSPLERALRRIEDARQKHQTEEMQAKAETTPNQSSVKYFPAMAPPKTSEFSARIEQPDAPAKFVAKTNVTPISELKTEKFDTNKLPPLPAKISSSFETPRVIHTLDAETEDEKLIFNRIENTPEASAETAAAIHEDEDADDCAPLALRFNAAIFDLLIGSFLSLLLLAPFALLNGNFFTSEGLLAFLATCAVVMFIYMTATIGFLGRTFGMKLFSLEIVDIDENAYPTIHQAAVSSSVYLVSLALGGLGFLTLLLNNEKRAAHDLLSNTIIVKEY